MLDDKLYDTKVVAAHSSWDAWAKFVEMYADTWHDQADFAKIENWRQVAYAAAQSTIYAGHHACPVGLRKVETHREIQSQEGPSCAN
jgi:hypothetical protein